MTRTGLGSNLSHMMTDQGSRVFGRRLQSERVAQRMSVEGLADKCRVRAKTIERWERGETDPQLDAAARAARVLGVSLDYLAGRVEK